MKTRLTLFVLLMIACPLTTMAQDATSRPADATAGPATRPESSSSRLGNYRGNRRFERRSTEVAAPAVPPGLPVIYNVVAARNIFIRGDQRPPPVDTNTGPIVIRQYAPTASQLVLTGVSLEDNTKVAFLEDQQAFTATRVKVGDQIANGKVVNITIDALDYKDPNGNIIRVTVGFNLAGGDVWGVANSSTSGSSTRPALTGPRAVGESMEDYLKRRRAAEMGH
jgi:hypothetical protein